MKSQECVTLFVHALTRPAACKRPLVTALLSISIFGIDGKANLRAIPFGILRGAEWKKICGGWSTKFFRSPLHIFFHSAPSQDLKWTSP